MGEIDGDGVGRHEFLSHDGTLFCARADCRQSPGAEVHSVPQADREAIAIAEDGNFTTEITLPAVQALDLDPLEFWRDLAEALGHQRPAKADIPALVSEIAAREQLIESLVEALQKLRPVVAVCDIETVDVALTTYATYKESK